MVTTELPAFNPSKLFCQSAGLDVLTLTCMYSTLEVQLLPFFSEVALADANQ